MIQPLCRRQPCGVRLLTNSQVWTIRSVYMKGRRPYLHELATIFGMHTESIRKIIDGRSYKDI